MTADVQSGGAGALGEAATQAGTAEEPPQGNAEAEGGAGTSPRQRKHRDAQSTVRATGRVGAAFANLLLERPVDDAVLRTHGWTAGGYVAAELGRQRLKLKGDDHDKRA